MANDSTARKPKPKTKRTKPKGLKACAKKTELLRAVRYSMDKAVPFPSTAKLTDAIDTKGGQDPDLSFDDELGWMHKDSLVVVNDLRAEAERLNKAKIDMQETIIALIANVQLWHKCRALFNEKCSVCVLVKQALSSAQNNLWGSDYIHKETVNALKHDIDAYRGALGYSVPADHDGKLSDGTTPQCGICNSEHQQAQRDLLRKCVTLLQQFLQPDTTIRDQIDCVREVKAVLSTASSLGINPSSPKTSSS